MAPGTTGSDWPWAGGPSARTTCTTRPAERSISAPANGGGDGKNFLHSNPFPNTASPGQPKECEAGNENFIAGRQVIGNVPGDQGTNTKEP